MSCGVCGPSNVTIRPEENLEICNEEVVETSDCVDVRIPVPREREFGLRNLRKLQDPKLPSKKEVEDHNLSGHMPYRSWCTYFVLDRGKAAPHTTHPLTHSPTYPPTHPLTHSPTYPPTHPCCFVAPLLG